MKLWSLIGQEGEGEAPGAAGEGLRWTAFRTLSDFLHSCRLEEDGFFLVSLGIEGVEETVLQRIVDAIGTADRLLLSAPGASLERALLARRLGAGRLLREPLSRDELLEELERREPAAEPIPLDPNLRPGGLTRLVGSSRAMAGVVGRVAEVAASTAPLLIAGESGTGKELVARAVHDSGPRADKPFVAINCAAVPEHLLESEFFGHERGAFTGAVARKRGRFERADGGTLFLDEIGDMGVSLQAKILRALEEGVVDRVGSEGSLHVDVRIVAASNRPLEELVRTGGFREDLYFRLSAARIDLPPLRARLDDLQELVLYFAAEFSERYEKPLEGVDRALLPRLREHPWPGNVRELRNVVDRAVRECTGGWVRNPDIRLEGEAPGVSPVPRGPGNGYPPTLSLEEVERDHIARVLGFTGGALGEAAAILGIHRNTLSRRISAHGLDATEDGA
ncbi:MAG: sigma-54 dependent transcriptional regulator [Gemmatimonadota bacterium]